MMKRHGLKAFQSAGYDVKEGELFQKGPWRVRVKTAEGEIRELTFLEYAYYAEPHLHDQDERLDVRSGCIKYWVSHNQGVSWDESVAGVNESIEVEAGILHCLRIESSKGAVVAQIPSINRGIEFSDVKGPV